MHIQWGRVFYFFVTLHARLLLIGFSGRIPRLVKLSTEEEEEVAAEAAASLVVEEATQVGKQKQG